MASIIIIGRKMASLQELCLKKLMSESKCHEISTFCENQVCMQNYVLKRLLCKTINFYKLSGETLGWLIYWYLDDKEIMDKIPTPYMNRFIYDCDESDDQQEEYIFYR